MAAKIDSQIGLHAVIYASQEQVIGACVRAADVLGKHARASTSPAKVTVSILPGLVTKLSQTSPVVRISVKPGPDGSTAVDAAIERFRTVQTRYLMIPISPKRLVGKSTYLNFLASLEQELKAIDAGRGSMQRTGAVR
jgi:hypothetical protein